MEQFWKGHPKHPFVFFLLPAHRTDISNLAFS